MTNGPESINNEWLKGPQNTLYSPSFLAYQSQQTAPARHFLYRKAQVAEASWGLDIGCGDGTITNSMSEYTLGQIVGLDIDPEFLNLATTNHKNAKSNWVLADAQYLPIRNQSCPFAHTHFTILWIQQPKQLFQELHRILRKHGKTVCLEPDYSGRITFNLKTKGKPLDSSRMIKTLLHQAGAHPAIGHQLYTLFQKNNFQITYLGVLAWEYHPKAATYESTLEKKLLNPKQKIDSSSLDFSYTPVLSYIATKQD